MKRFREIYVDPYPVYNNLPSDDVYVDKMQQILSAPPYIGVTREPSSIMGTVYLGNTANAENISQLKSMGITYILNCAGGGPLKIRRVRDLYTPETGVKGYEELPIDDTEYTDIRSYFDRGFAFLDYARNRHSKVLIHCPGVSRSGTIAIGYLMRNGMPLLEATKLVKDRRRCALSNIAFMKQLVAYGRERGLLDPIDNIEAPRFGRALDKHRIMTAHLPLYRQDL